MAVLPERTSNKEILVGRNYDFSVDDWTEDRGIVFETYPSSGLASIGTHETWVDRIDGLNEEGLWVAFTGSPLESESKPGLSPLALVRLILDRCANVEEGTAQIKKVPLIHRIPGAVSMILDRP